jgi:hypothetical protein
MMMVVVVVVVVEEQNVGMEFDKLWPYLYIILDWKGAVRTGLH